MMPGTVAREILLHASPGEVWEALTNGRQVSEWFGAEVEMTARLGGRVRFRFPDGRERGAVIEAFDTERLLVLRWMPFETDARGRTRTRPSTNVRFTLGLRDDCTLLSVQETLPLESRQEPSPDDAVDLGELGTAGLRARARAAR
jgi:uncharacterized protein YndB with AHSA1/START domain